MSLLYIAFIDFVLIVLIQEAMLDTLNSKVEDVYGNCIGDNEANIRYV